MKESKTNRGFGKGRFRDYNGNECSIQDSSLADDDCIWLGQNEGTHHLGECLARMHLTRKMVSELLPYLQCFVNSGTIYGGAPTPEPPKVLAVVEGWTYSDVVGIEKWWDEEAGELTIEPGIIPGGIPVTVTVTKRKEGGE